MKTVKYIFVLLLGGSCMITFASSGDNILRPSIMQQMQYQKKLDRKNIQIALIKAKKKGNQIAPSRSSTGAIATEKVIINTLSGISATKPNPTKEISPIGRESFSSHRQIQGVDIKMVRTTWLKWYNEVRAKEGLSLYQYDNRLDATAHAWNLEFSLSKGNNHHRRASQDGYYDFSKIDQWFIRSGINPKIINRSKHTENVGYGYYNCDSLNCTDALIRSIRTTFDFYMKEKGRSYDPHYRSIINPYFSKIGLDILVIPDEKRYYITVHYITE